MKAFVTGCAGFIGSHIADRLLNEGYKVIGIDCFTDYYPRPLKESNLESARNNSNFILIEKDILDMPSFPEVDYVFHQAAQAGVRASWGSNFTIYTRNNIEATQKLLEWYKDTPLKKFVYASSSSVYGDAPLPMHEDMRPQPVSPYGVSKLAAEHLCYLYWKNFHLPAVSLRYFTVYGPRQRPDMAINKFVHAILQGKRITLFGDGKQTRDFTYISDAVEANILAARYNGCGNIFNIGGNSRITVIDLINTLESICKKRADIVYIDQQKGDAIDTLAEVTKASKILGWNAKISIFQGLSKYIEWINMKNQVS